MPLFMIKSVEDMGFHFANSITEFSYLLKNI